MSKSDDHANILKDSPSFEFSALKWLLSGGLRVRVVIDNTPYTGFVHCLDFAENTNKAFALAHLSPKRGESMTVPLDIFIDGREGQEIFVQVSEKFYTSSSVSINTQIGSGILKFCVTAEKWINGEAGIPIDSLNVEVNDLGIFANGTKVTVDRIQSYLRLSVDKKTYYLVSQKNQEAEFVAIARAAEVCWT